MTRDDRLAATAHRRLLTIAMTAVIALVPVSGVGLAHGAPILTFESHVGTRSKEAARLIEQLAGALELHGFAARTASILKLTWAEIPAQNCCS
jgi:hypothetical protein